MTILTCDSILADAPFCSRRARNSGQLAVDFARAI
jgi:hypothetical protein